MDRKHMPSHPFDGVHNMPLALVLFMMRHDDVLAAEKLAKDQLSQYNLRCRIMLVSKDSINLERKIAQLDNRIQLLVHSSVYVSPSASGEGSLTPRPTCPLVFSTPRLFHIPYTNTHAQRSTSWKSIPKKDLEQYEELLYIIQQRPQLQTHLLHAGNGKTENYNMVQSQFIVMELYASPNDERQERQLLEFFASSLKLQVEASTDKHQFLRSNSSFTQMLSLFARRGKGVGVLKQLLSAKLEIICSSKVDTDLAYHACLQAANLATPVGTRLEYDTLPEAAKKIHAQRQEVLLDWVEGILDQIYCSVSLLPASLRWICLYLYHLTKFQWKDVDDSFAQSIVGGFQCLRFINPCIVSPNAFEIVSETPNKIAKKSLVLIAKVIQNVSNGVLFKPSEPHLCSMNSFIERQIPLMKQFLFNATQVEGMTDGLSCFLHDHSRESIVLTSIGHLYSIHQVLWMNFDGICASLKKNWMELEASSHDSVVAYTDLVTKSVESSSSTSSNSSNGCMSPKKEKRSTIVYDHSQLKEILETEGDVLRMIEELKIIETENNEFIGFDDSEGGDEFKNKDDEEFDEFCDLPNEVPLVLQHADESDSVYQARQKQTFHAWLPRAENQSRSGQQELRSVLLRLGEPVGIPPDAMKPLNETALSLRVSLPPVVAEPAELVVVLDPVTNSGLQETLSEDGSTNNSGSGVGFRNSSSTPDIPNRPRNSAISMTSSAVSSLSESRSLAHNDEDGTISRKVMQYYYSSTCICERGNSLFELESNPCACAVGFTSVLGNFLKFPKLSIPGMESIIYAMLIHVLQYTPSLHVLASKIAKIRTNSIENNLILAASLPSSMLIRYLQESLTWVESNVDPLFYIHIEEDVLIDSDDSDEELERSTVLRKTCSQRVSGFEGNIEFEEGGFYDTKPGYGPRGSVFAPLYVQKVKLQRTSPYLSYLFPESAPPSVRVETVVELLKCLNTKKAKGSVQPLRKDMLQWINDKHDSVLQKHAKYVGRKTNHRILSKYYGSGKVADADQSDIYAPDMLYTHRKSIYVKPAPTIQHEQGTVVALSRILPTLPTEHNYKRMQRRSVIEKHVELQQSNKNDKSIFCSLASPLVPLFQQNKFVIKETEPSASTTAHICDTMCIGFCQYGYDIACVNYTTQSVRVSTKKRNDGQNYIVSKWCSEVLTEIPREIQLEIDSKLQQLRDTLLIVHKHSIQLLEREEMYTEYLRDCRKSQQKSLTQKNGEDKSLSHKLKSMVFRLNLKGAVQGAVEDIKNVDYCDQFTLERNNLDMTLVQGQNQRKYQLRILRKKRILVAENLLKAKKQTSITVGMQDALTCFITLDGLDTGVTVALEDLFYRKQAVQTLYDESLQWNHEMPVVDTRALRCDLGDEERQLNHYTVYQHGEEKESKNHTVMGINERGSLVCQVWIQKTIVIDLVALLGRVIYKHFVKP